MNVILLKMHRCEKKRAQTEKRGGPVSLLTISPMKAAAAGRGRHWSHYFWIFLASAVSFEFDRIADRNFPTGLSSWVLMGSKVIIDHEDVVAVAIIFTLSYR